MTNQTSSDVGLIVIPALVTLLVGLAVIALTLRLATLPDEATGTVVVVFPINTSAATIFDAVVQAEGRLVNNTLLDNVWIVHSERTDFVHRLKTKGAWSAFNPSMFQPITMAGCFVVSVNRLQ